MSLEGQRGPTDLRQNATSIKKGAKYILNDKIEPEFKSPRFQHRTGGSYYANAAQTSHQKGRPGKRSVVSPSRINSDYFPSDAS